MASIYKHKSGKWVAAVRRKGHTARTRSFTRHSDAKRWAAEQEIQTSETLPSTKAHTLHQLLQRFEREVLPSYKSQRTTSSLLCYWKRELPDQQLEHLTPQDIANYRDKRLTQHVSGSTVNRELNQLSKIIDTAIREWGWFDRANPVRAVTRPKNPRHRDRRPSTNELERLRKECIRSNNLMMWAVIDFAVESGMRQGEILSLRIEDIDFVHRTLHLEETKNGDSRDVPLSNNAVRILKDICGERHEGCVFNNWTTDDGFRSTFYRIRSRAGIEGLRFHDLRHEAASRFFERGLNQFQVAAITGHRSLQSLYRYTHLKAKDLVELLD